jgi:hypothetical protein
MKETTDNELNTDEIRKRMEAGLKRALTTPHKPHKPLGGHKRAIAKSPGRAKPK